MQKREQEGAGKEIINSGGPVWSAQTKVGMEETPVMDGQSTTTTDHERRTGSEMRGCRWDTSGELEVRVMRSGHGL